MACLVEPYIQGQSSVIGEALLTRAMQVLAALQTAAEGAAEVGIVVEVANSGASNPAMWLAGTERLQFMGGAEAQAGKVIVKVVLVLEEAGQSGLVVASDGVVVAKQEKAGAQPFRKRLDAGQERGEEALLPGDLLGTTVPRRNVDAEHSELRRSVEENGGGPAGLTDRDLGDAAAYAEAAGEKDATVTLSDRRVDDVAIGFQAGAEELSSRASAGLAENDDVVASAAQPVQNFCGARFGGGSDVESEDAGTSATTMLCGTGTASTGMASVSAGVRLRGDCCRHRVGDPVRAVRERGSGDLFAARMRCPAGSRRQ